MIQVGERGTIIRVSLIDEEKRPRDVSAATTRQIIIRRLSCGTSKHKSADFFTDGKDGMIYFTTTVDDFDKPGPWEIQAYIDSVAWTGFSTSKTFNVYDVL